jgi:hypothetical protein
MGAVAPETYRAKIKKNKEYIKSTSSWNFN